MWETLEWERLARRASSCVAARFVLVTRRSSSGRKLLLLSGEVRCWWGIKSNRREGANGNSLSVELGCVATYGYASPLVKLFVTVTFCEEGHESIVLELVWFPSDACKGTEIPRAMTQSTTKRGWG